MKDPEVVAESSKAPVSAHSPASSAGWQRLSSECPHLEARPGWARVQCASCSLGGAVPAELHPASRGLPGHNALEPQGEGVGSALGERGDEEGAAICDPPCARRKRENKITCSRQSKQNEPFPPTWVSLAQG